MYSFQDEALDWMKVREMDPRVSGGFICHEMGLGKTRMMSRLVKENLRHRTLVLTTKSTLGGWLSELRHQSKFEFDVREYDKTLRLDPVRPAVIVATHHSILCPLWFLRQNFDRVIVDEAHILRNQGRIYMDIYLLPAKYRWGVTATPYNNSNADMNAYTNFLRPGMPGSAFRHYMLRKTRAEVITDGPALISHKLVYDFDTEEERRMYEFVARRIDDTHEWVRRNGGRLPRHVENVMKLTLLLRERQAAVHPQIVLDAERVWRKQFEDAGGEISDWSGKNVTKFTRILELVKNDQKHHKSTMIVTHFKRELDLLKEMCERNGIPVLTLDARTTGKERRRLETFESIEYSDIMSIMSKKLPGELAASIAGYVMKPQVLLLQIRAGGVGLSLPWVHHVINTTPDWNPFTELQAIYRAYRVTTKHDVVVTSMYFKDTIETAIQERQTKKLMESLEWTGDALESISEFIRMPIE